MKADHTAVSNEARNPMEPSPNGIGRPPDQLAAALDEVKAELAARRAAGEIPELRAGELDRQFSAVIETVDGTLLDEPDVDTEGLRPLAELPTYEPGRRGLVGLLAPLTSFWSRLVGAIVRRQVAPFAQRSTTIVEQLAERQRRALSFLGRVHLDRVRVLEYRVAELEREVERLRIESSADNDRETVDGP